MNIGIDARMYGIEHAGIGRYVENLIEELLRAYPDTKFTLFLRGKEHKEHNFPKNVTKVRVDIKHYSVKEQLEFPKILANHPVDVMHFPHFNVPILYKSPFVVTIHDLLWHEVKGLNVTTLSPMKYMLKYVGYRLVVDHAVKKSLAVMVPSNWVKQQVLNQVHVSSGKIVVTNEGVDEDYLRGKGGESFEKLKKKLKVEGDFLVYTGSAYPHKNLRRLIQAIGILNRIREQPIMLVIVSARNIFLKQLREYVVSQDLDKKVIFAGRLSDKEVVTLYSKAKMLVHPSMSEGFGLTGLEAMAVGTPVVASNAGSLPEVYGKAALYANPQDPADIAKKIEEVLDNKQKAKSLVTAGKKRAKKYSWAETAVKTFEVYQEFAG